MLSQVLKLLKRDWVLGAPDREYREGHRSYVPLTQRLRSALVLVLLSGSEHQF